MSGAVDVDLGGTTSSGRCSSSATGWATSTSAKTTGATWARVTWIRAVLPGVGFHRLHQADHLRKLLLSGGGPGAFQRSGRVAQPVERRRNLARHAHQFITEQLFLNRVAA